MIRHLRLTFLTLVSLSGAHAEFSGCEVCVDLTMVLNLAFVSIEATTRPESTATSNRRTINRSTFSQGRLIHMTDNGYKKEADESFDMEVHRKGYHYKGRDEKTTLEEVES